MQCGMRSPRLPLSGDRCTGKTLPVLLLPRRGRRCSFFAGEFWWGKRCDQRDALHRFPPCRLETSSIYECIHLKSLTLRQCQAEIEKMRRLDSVR